MISSSGVTAPPSGNSSTDSAAWLDETADRFETAWQSGEEPRIEDFLSAADEPRRERLLRELVQIEVQHRHENSETPQPSDYVERFPELKPDWLEEVFAAAQSVNLPDGQGRPDVKRIRCPHCQNPIKIVDERMEEVSCLTCGSSVQVSEHLMATTLQHSKRIGKFHLFEVVGRGSFGEVWRARDTELGRIVALKVPHGGVLGSVEGLERFQREARTAAQLRHPGIVPIYEIADLNGVPALVSEFVEGVTLRALLDVRLLQFRETAEMVAEVADALDYAHTMGSIHRDIAPGNVMVERRNQPRLEKEDSDSSDETAASENGKSDETAEPEQTVGKPRIMDFGLALRDEAEITLTIEGQILGTPAYMSPEQALGKGETKVDGRSDIYSLGAALYQMLCGQLPFRGSKLMIRDQVLHEEPRRPRSIIKKVPRDLETIALKAMSKSPPRRYATAREMADDLRRWLDDEPIRARSVSRLERTWRWCRRNPAKAAMTTALALVLLAWAGSATWLWRESENQRALRQTERDRAERFLRQARNVVDDLEKLAADVPEQYRDPLLETVRDYYERFAREKGIDDPRFKFEVAKNFFNLGQVHTTKGQTDKAMESFGRAADLFDELAEEGPDNRQHRHHLARSLKKTAYLYQITSRLEQAESNYDRAVEIRKSLINDYPNVVEYRKQYAITLTGLGHVYADTDRTAEADKLDREALEIHEELGRSHPHDLDYPRQQAIIHGNRAYRYQERKNYSLAAASYEEALTIQDKLNRRHPDEFLISRSLGVTLNNLAGVYSDLGKQTEADTTRKRCLAIREELVARQPYVLNHQVDLGVSYSNEGDHLIRTKKFAEAMPFLDKEVATLGAVYKQEPRHAEVRQTFVNSLNNRGAALMGLTRHAAAADDYSRAVEVSEAWAKQSSETHDKFKLATRYRRLMFAHDRAGDKEAALKACQREVELNEELVRERPTNVFVKVKRAQSCWNLGHMHMNLWNVDEGVKWHSRGLALYQEFQDHEQIKTRPVYAERLKAFERELALHKQLQRAVGDLEFALTLPPKRTIAVLEKRAQVFLKRKEHEEVVRTSEKLRPLAADAPNAIYNIACFYSLCSNLVSEDPLPLTQQQQKLREQYQLKAVESLKQAISAGFEDFKLMQKDSDLDALRQRDDFKKLIEKRPEPGKNSPEPDNKTPASSAGG